MVFSSPIFLYLFLPLVIGLYLLAPKRWRNGVLLASSLVFYWTGGNNHIWVLVCSIVANYALGVALGAEPLPVERRKILILALVVNLTLLFYYKYANFAVRQVNQVAGYKVISSPGIMLPIGISFFTFQALSYVIDVYAGRVAVQKNILNFALYIALFPQLIAGPIVRYRDVAAQIRERLHSLDKFHSGLVRFAIGLAKKVVIANTLGAVADAVLQLKAEQVTMPVAWFGIGCYAFQIFYDFAGYSDMAIGLGRMFGFEFLENFNYPYTSKSIMEFWRRWHISLSTWFRDYLYIPLGGNRFSPARHYGNLLLVFALCGFWHGASWNFLVWGLWHGAFLIIEHTPLRRGLDRLPAPFRHLYVILVVCVGWAVFRINGIPQAAGFIGCMFDFGVVSPAAIDLGEFLNLKTGLVFAAAALFAMPVAPWINAAWGRRRADPALTPAMRGVYALVDEISGGLVVVGLIIISALALASSGFNPFIYFRF